MVQNSDEKSFVFFLLPLCCRWISCRHVWPQCIAFRWETLMLPCLLLSLKGQRKKGLIKVIEKWMYPVAGLSVSPKYISHPVLFMSLVCFRLPMFFHFTLPLSQAVTHRFKKRQTTYPKLVSILVLLFLSECIHLEKFWWQWKLQQLINWGNLCEISPCLYTVHYSSQAQQVSRQPLNQQVVQHEKAWGFTHWEADWCNLSLGFKKLPFPVSSYNC